MFNVHNWMSLEVSIYLIYAMNIPITSEIISIIYKEGGSYVFFNKLSQYHVHFLPSFLAGPKNITHPVKWTNFKNAVDDFLYVNTAQTTIFPSTAEF